MRVIAGKARRIQLDTPKGQEVRPTTDRIKETLFNILNPYIYDSYFLDLFSGSGAIGIEALSRGAKEVTFIENNQQALACIKDNLERTKLIKNANIYNSDVIKALKKINDKKFDLIFMDPPYNKAFEKDVLVFLSQSDIINQNTIIIVESDLETKFDYLNELGFNTYKIKKYKNNKHIFIEYD